MNKHTFLRLLLLITVIITVVITNTKAQYYLGRCMRPGNPNNINTDPDWDIGTQAPPNGATIIMSYDNVKSYSLQYSPVQTLPFDFTFNGKSVKEYKVSPSGYLTFTTSDKAPAGTINSTLPSASIPDNSICVWGLGPAADGGKIYTKVYGIAPDRQLWVVFHLAGNPKDPNSESIWAIVLEEYSNDIYLVDEWDGFTANTSIKYQPFTPTLGIQINSSKAYQVSNSYMIHTAINSPCPTDNIWYRFSADSRKEYSPQPKMVLIEDFTQASCDPCFIAAPNIDSVLLKNQNFCAAIRYHDYWPGTDYMNAAVNDVTIDGSYSQTEVVGPRVSYYGVNSEPDGFMDGTYNFDPASITSGDIQSEAFQLGSPFTITQADTFNYAKNLFTVAVTITAYQSFPAGLTLQAVLEVDTMKYSFDQSTEDPGNNSTYLLNFPEVAEEMIPTSSGTALGAVTNGEVKNINLSWKKNRSWGYEPKTYKYDSTGVHMVLFIQDNSSKTVYQASYAAPVILGVQNIDNSITGFNLYPNPTKDLTNISFALSQSQNVTVEVYNLLGQKVFTTPMIMMGGGQHIYSIETSTFHSGVYFVQLTTNGSTLTKRLEVIK